jgi:hypothetical protein
MLTVRQSTVLLRIPAGLAIRLKTTQRNQDTGWNAVPAHDGSPSRKTVKRFRTQLLPGDSRMFLSGVGNTPRDARARTLALALNRVSHAARDLTVEYVRIRRYPGFFLSTLVIYPSSLQESVIPPSPLDESSL